MNCGHLFNGIGGFALAAHWMGWNNLMHCEIDPFCNQAMNHHFPNSYQHEDVRTADFKIWRGRLNVLTGGFPCQDASNANQNNSRIKGLLGARTGLFFEMLRAVDEIRPTFLVAENVANILRTNEGADFSTILTELSRMGYNAEWRVCYASEKGAPHRRARLYLVAYPGSFRLQKGETFIPYIQETSEPFLWNIAGTTVQINRAGAWSTEPPVPCVDDGLSGNVVRSCIQAYGNAIVPEIAFSIFQSIDRLYNC